MSRRKRKRKVVAFRAHIQGRKIRALRKVKILNDEEFSYRGFVYLIDNFPPHSEINMDTTDVAPVREFEGVYEKQSKSKKGKNKVVKRTYAAQMYSNVGECSDVESIFKNKG